MDRSDDNIARPRHRARVLIAALCLAITGGGCEAHGTRPDDIKPHMWWEARGPVVPHDTFPKECGSCHLSSGWESIREDFSFDHALETGVPLRGAHATTECLLCHNDKGPVAVFAARGCMGCHEDIHLRQLGVNCTDCHTEFDWVPVGQIAQHNRTRFPLTGAHAATACFQCHEGALVGNFDRTDIECLSCHQDDLNNANNPDHAALGWVVDCHLCHVPTGWQFAVFPQ